MENLNRETGEVPEIISVTIMKNLGSFKENYPSLFLQFALKCRKPNHQLSGITQKTAMEYDLITADGEIHDIVKNIVLSSVNIDDLDRVIATSKPSVKSSPEDDLFFLCFAAEDMERINKLLSIEGINVNKQFHFGETCLIRAARRGNIALVKSLLQKGADKNITDSLGNTPADVTYSKEIKRLLNTKKKQSANHVLNSREQLVPKPAYTDRSSLYKKPNSPSFTPQSSIAKSAEEELFELCWEAKDMNRIEHLLSTPDIKINKKFFLEDTCLIRAARKGHKELVCLLLQKNADRSIKNITDNTAADVASSQEIKELINSWKDVKQSKRSNYPSINQLNNEGIFNRKDIEFYKGLQQIQFFQPKDVATDVFEKKKVEDSNQNELSRLSILEDSSTEDFFEGAMLQVNVDNNTLDIIFDDVDKAKACRGKLRDQWGLVDIHNTSQPKKIHMPDDNTFVIQLTGSEYDIVVGPGKYNELAAQQNSQSSFKKALFA